MKRKLILLFIITLCLTGCSSLKTPDLNRKIVASHGVLNTESLSQIESKQENDNANSNSTVVNAYQLMEKLGIIQLDPEDSITTKNITAALNEAGYNYEDFSIDKLDKNCICFKGSMIAICMAKTNDVYTMYIYDNDNVESKTLTNIDIEKYKFDKIFTKEN